MYSTAEFNTIVTMLGCLCACVQAGTGIYASVVKKKIALLKTNDILFRSHRAFGSFATTLYFLGLFAGLTGFVGSLTVGSPPFEPNDASFNIHVWPSFLVIIVIVWKTWISYFKKGSVYKRGKILGIATFLAWSFTWISSAFSYYLRTIPPNEQHPDPSILMPYSLMGVQIIMPFLIGGLIAFLILTSVKKREQKTLENQKK